MIPSPPLTARDYSSDTGLALRVASGEREAQHELFRCLRSTVHRTLYRVLGSNEHMEDLLQDAFIEIFRSIPSYRGEAQLSTWADRIAARVAFHYLKRKRSSVDRERAPVQLHVVGSPERSGAASRGARAAIRPSPAHEARTPRRAGAVSRGWAARWKRSPPSPA